MKAYKNEPRFPHWVKSPDEIDALPAVESPSGQDELRRSFLFDLTVLALFSVFFLLRMMS